MKEHKLFIKTFSQPSDLVV